MTFGWFLSETEQPAHRELWKHFTSRVLRVLALTSRTRRNVVALWGDYAQQLLSGRWREVAGESLRVITAPHPSAPGVTFHASGIPLARINDELEPRYRIAWNASAA